jgi:uncharacterized protein YciI
VYLIYCVDRPNSEQLRTKIRPDHLAYLKRYEEKIAIGGPILGEENKPTGTVLIMNFNDQKSVDDFLEREPYHKGGLFETRIVRPWRGVTGSWVPRLEA